MSRMPIPPRRRSVTLHTVYKTDTGGEQPLLVTYSVTEEGTVFEVFMDGPKTNDMSRLAKDTGMLISSALQHGASLETISAALGKDDETGRRHSIAGIAVDAIMADWKS